MTILCSMVTIFLFRYWLNGVIIEHFGIFSPVRAWQGVKLLTSSAQVFLTSCHSCYKKAGAKSSTAILIGKMLVCLLGIVFVCLYFHRIWIFVICDLSPVARTKIFSFQSVRYPNDLWFDSLNGSYWFVMRFAFDWLMSYDWNNPSGRVHFAVLWVNSRVCIIGGLIALSK
jgi:hypothetical protein